MSKTYNVTLSDGRKVTVKADKPPTKEQVLAALKKQDVKAQVKEDRSFKKGGPITQAKNAAQALQREEASVAAPALRVAKAIKGPKFGEDSAPVSMEGLTGDFMKGIKGETFSPYQEGRQIELGDVAREFGVPDPIAAGLGLAASGALPSSILMGQAGRGVTRLLPKSMPKTKLPVGNDFQNLVRQIEQGIGKVPKVVAETIEALTGVPSEHVVDALRHPEILTKENADPELISDFSRKLAQRVKDGMKKRPTDFGPSEEIPYEIARRVTDEFNIQIEEAGQKVHKITQEYKGSTNISAGEIDRGIKKVMSRFLDQEGNIKPIFADDPVAATIQEMRDSLNLLNTKQMGGNTIIGKPLTIEDILDFKKKIKYIGYKRGTPTFDGINRPLPEVQGSIQAIYGYINSLIEREFQDSPDFLDAFKNYSKLAEVRGDVSTRLGNPEKLARFMRKIDRKDPEQLVLFNELLSVIPNKDKFVNELDMYLNLEANSIRNIFPFIDEKDLDSVAVGFEKLLRKDLRSTAFDIRDKTGLDKLQRVVGPDMDILRTYMDHHTASQFAKKSNFFRALAAGTITLGSLTAMGGVGGVGSGVATFMAGMAATDPRLQGAMIRNTARPIQRILPMAKQGVQGTAAGIATTGTRKAISELDQPSEAEIELGRQYLQL